MKWDSGSGGLWLSQSCYYNPNTKVKVLLDALVFPKNWQKNQQILSFVLCKNISVTPNVHL